MGKFHTAVTWLGIGSLLFISGCGGGNTIDETPTRGNIRIAADESFRLLVDTEINTFQSLYTYAHITPQYNPETEVIANLMNDSVPMIVVTRKLTQTEENLLRSRQIIARTTKFAYDAVAFILNPANPDSNLRYDQVEGIMKGRITRWKQMNPSSPLQEVVVVFDNNKSGNFRFLQEKFLRGSQVPSSFYALKNNPEVLEYVKNKPNAIGVIAVNWVSDKDDTLSNRFMSGIRIAGIGSEGDLTGSNGFKKPFQGYIAEGSYPFTREVFAICRESFAGLGTGFVSFLAGDVGQRIVLKSGLVPATMPVRLVQIKKNFD